MVECKITLQDDTSIPSTNANSPDDLDNLQIAMTEISKSRAQAFCNAFQNGSTQDWFYSILKETGIFKIFNIFDIDFPIELTPQLIRALIAFNGDVDANTFDEILTILYGANNYNFSVDEARPGVLILRILNQEPTSRIVFENEDSTISGAIWQDGDAWVKSLPDLPVIPKEVFLILRFFIAFGIQLDIRNLNSTFGIDFLLKGGAIADYTLTEMSVDSNSRLYITDSIGDIYFSENYGGFWNLLYINIDSQLFKKCFTLTENDIEYIVVLGGVTGFFAPLAEFLEGDYSNKEDFIFLDLVEFSICKASENRCFVYGGVDSSNNFYDNLYEIIIRDGSIFIRIDGFTATGTSRKNANFVRKNDNTLILCYGVDSAGDFLTDLYEIDVTIPYGAVSHAKSLVLPSYKFPAVYHKNNNLFLTGGELVAGGVNRKSERISSNDFLSVVELTPDIGFDFVNNSTIFIEKLDSIRIMNENGIYGI